MIADAMVSTGLAAAGYKYVNLGKDKTIEVLELHIILTCDSYLVLYA